MGLDPAAPESEDRSGKIGAIWLEFQTSSKGLQIPPAVAPDDDGSSTPSPTCTDAPESRTVMPKKCSLRWDGSKGRTDIHVHSMTKMLEGIRVLDYGSVGPGLVPLGFWPTMVLKSFV